VARLAAYTPRLELGRVIFDMDNNKAQDAAEGHFWYGHRHHHQIPSPTGFCHFLGEEDKHMQRARQQEAATPTSPEYCIGT
jgi:hypothetical protein